MMLACSDGFSQYRNFLVCPDNYPTKRQGFYENFFGLIRFPLSKSSKDVKSFQGLKVCLSFGRKYIAVKKSMQEYLKFSIFFFKILPPKKHQKVRGDPRVVG